MITYSKQWAEGVWLQVARSYPRATNLLALLSDRYREKGIMLLASASPLWQLYREFTRVFDNWLCKLPPESRSTTRMLSYTEQIAKLVARNRAYHWRELLTAFGLWPILGEQSLSQGGDPPPRRVGEGNQPTERGGGNSPSGIVEEDQLELPIF